MSNMEINNKEKAISLRKQGLSYSEILKRIPIAKSTLSLWLHNIGLSKKQYQRLTEKKLAAMRRGARRKHEIKVEKIIKIKKSARQEVKKLISTPLMVNRNNALLGGGRKRKR